MTRVQGPPDERSISPLLAGLLRHPSARALTWGPAPEPGSPGREPGAPTYGWLAEASAGVARELLAGGASLAGARVALLTPPGVSFLAALLGIWRAGGVAVPLAATHTPPELAHILAVAAPEIVIADETLAGNLAGVIPAGARAADLATTVRGRVGGDADAAGATIAGAAPDAPALMLFTSGTTGKPKGVLVSHAGVAATLATMADAWRWRADDRLLHTLPLYHTHGLIVALLGAVWIGAAVRFMAFAAREIWDALGDATVFMAVPTMYVRLAEAFAGATPEDRARWAAGARRARLLTSGSAALPATLLATIEEATGQRILERYGMTEIGMALSNPYDGPRVPGAVGVPLPGVTVDIVDEEGRPVADGEPGELRVRSPQMFMEYAGDADATAAGFDEAGRFRTGDTGVRDDRGFIRLLGRTSVDILKSGGYKLSALEIEDVLRAHPAVAEVAVIATPDPVWGDAVTACVVARAGTTPPTLDDLREFARAALAPYKLPRVLRVLAALPRNPMGKVQKSLLR